VSGFEAVHLTSGGCGHQAEHVVIVEMENRSFDHYFGTFPAVNGLPGRQVENGLVTGLQAARQQALSEAREQGRKSHVGYGR